MGIVDGILNLVGTGMTNAQNERMASDQRKFDLKMWNQANLYNSPEMQMERLKKAGLNPNLVYGSGSVAGQTSGPPPKYQQYDIKNPLGGFNTPGVPEIVGMLGTFQNIQTSKATENLARKNAELVDQKISTEFFNTLLKQVQGQKLNQDYRFLRDTFETRSKLAGYSTSVKEQLVKFQQLQNNLLAKRLNEQFPIQTKLLSQESELSGYNVEMAKQRALNAKQLGNYNLSDKDAGILKTIVAIWSALFGNDNR